MVLTVLKQKYGSAIKNSKKKKKKRFLDYFNQAGASIHYISNGNF